MCFKTAAFTIGALAAAKLFTSAAVMMLISVEFFPPTRITLELVSVVYQGAGRILVFSGNWLRRFVMRLAGFVLHRQ